MFEYGRSVCLCNCHNLLYQHSDPCCTDMGKPYVYAEVKGGQYKPGDILDVKVLNAAS